METVITETAAMTENEEAREVAAATNKFDKSYAGIYKQNIYLETVVLQVSIQTSEMLEDMAYKFRHKERFSQIANLTKTRLCEVLLEAIVCDEEVIGENQFSQKLIFIWLDYMQSKRRNK